MDQIQICLMERFSVSVNGAPATQTLNKSRKGVALMQYLILAGGQTVSNQRLLAALWPDEKNTNPENALKTLVSRTRAQLNQLSEGLGNCIVADRGAYHWESIEGVFVDVLAIEETLTALEKGHLAPAARVPLYRELLRLYTGDFLQNEEVEQDEWVLSRVTSLHVRFMDELYEYIALLKEERDFEEIVVVCRQGLAVSSFDDRLHTELINALVAGNRHNEAMQQYKTAEQMSFRYLGRPPSPELQEFYEKCISAVNTLDASLETITGELQSGSGENGAHVCDYAVFKDICNLEASNVERLGAAMNLVLIHVSDISGQASDSLEQDNMMQTLMIILRRSLRRGDLITRYSPSIVALLLPMKDPTMGDMVIERIRREFYRKYSNSRITFRYRITRLRSDAGEKPAGRSARRRPEN